MGEMGERPFQQTRTHVHVYMYYIYQVINLLFYLARQLAEHEGRHRLPEDRGHRAWGLYGAMHA